MKTPLNKNRKKKKIKKQQKRGLGRNCVQDFLNLQFYLTKNLPCWEKKEEKTKEKSLEKRTLKATRHEWQFKMVPSSLVCVFKFGTFLLFFEIFSNKAPFPIKRTKYLKNNYQSVDQSHNSTKHALKKKFWQQAELPLTHAQTMKKSSKKKYSKIHQCCYCCCW